MEQASTFPGQNTAAPISGRFAETGFHTKRDVLVVFSHVWQEAGELNFGSGRDLCTGETIERAKTRRLLANLRDAQGLALGVDSAPNGKSTWECSRQFWTRYFAESGATLRVYSVLRDASSHWLN